MLFPSHFSRPTIQIVRKFAKKRRVRNSIFNNAHYIHS